MAESSDWERELVAEILNKYSLNTNRERVLIRAVGSEIRGVMSDSYRRLNSQVILESFINQVYASGGVLYNGHMSDTRMYIETIYPKPIMIPTKNNGEVAIAFGCRFASSDYGDGALDVRSFFLQGACLNGAVRESMMRVIHLGSKLPDNIQLSENTYKLDTKTQASAVKDIASQMFHEDTIMLKSMEIQRSSEIEVDMDKELKGLKKHGITEDEVKEISTVLMNGRPEDGIQGTNSLWKLVQGVTAVARTKDAQKMRDFQEIGGKLMDRVH